MRVFSYLPSDVTQKEVADHMEQCGALETVYLGEFSPILCGVGRYILCAVQGVESDPEWGATFNVSE